MSSQDEYNTFSDAENDDYNTFSDAEDTNQHAEHHNPTLHVDDIFRDNDDTGGQSPVSL